MYLIDEDNKARASHLQSHFTCLPCQVENKMQYHPHFAAGEKGRRREGGGPATEVDRQGTGLVLRTLDSIPGSTPGLLGEPGQLLPLPPCVGLDCEL